MKIGNKLAMFRKNCGLTQLEVANKLGIAKSAVGNWERDLREPNFEFLNKLAQLYNVPIGEFFEEKNKENLNNLLIDKIINDLIDENVITEQQSVEDLDAHTQQILLGALNKHIASIIKNKKDK